MAASDVASTARLATITVVDLPKAGHETVPQLLRASKT